MRICIICGGFHEHIQRLSNYLVIRNNQVHVISSRVAENPDNGVVLHILGNKPILWPLQVKQLVASIKPDIVDGHFASVYGFLAAITGFHPLVVTVWGSDIFIQPWKNSFWKLITRYSLKRADVINCLFPMSVAEPALTKLGVNISKVRTTLLGVDTSEFKPMEYDIELAREIGISSDKPLVINPRGFAPVYDYTTFFNAIPAVIAEVPDAKFLALYKRGQREIGERLVNQLGIGDSVVLREWLSRSMMPKLLSLADIYVSTSLSDGASNSLFEAMACELAPVVTDIPANRPWITDGENGFLFPAGDSKTLAERIIRLLKDKSLRSQFGKICRQLVQEKAEQSQEMKKIEDTYRELISAHCSLKGTQP